MPRIFKFSKFALKLFVPHASELSDMKIYIYTDNFDIAYVFTSGFKINVNEVGLVVPQNAVSNMSDGVINYRIEGYLNGEFYIEQRQSNYYLKTPSFEIEDETIIDISTEFVDGGNYKMIIKASEYNADGLSQVEIDATTFAEEKYETGKQIQKELMEPITITSNGTYTREDGYNEVVVDVIPKISVKDYGLSFSISTFTEVPEWADFEGATDLRYMFYNCLYLQTIPLLDTSNVTNMSCVFGNCESLQTISLLNTSNVTNMSYMFSYCFKLQTIPLLDTSNVTDMSFMFLGCVSLQTIPPIDTSNVTNMSFMFCDCRNLQTIPLLDTSNVTDMSFYFGDNNLNNLTDVGGWNNLKCNWSDNDGLRCCPNLSYQSCINILNGLADVTELGSRTLKVHQNFLDLVGDEISIGINKGWIIKV